MPAKKRSRTRSTARGTRRSRGPDLGLAKLQLEALHVVAQQHGGIEVGVQVQPGLLLGVPPVVVTRPSDLLRLRFSFDNLLIDTVDDRLVLTRARNNAQARLVVDHQPQHLVEEAGFEALDKNNQPKFDKPPRPVQTRLSTHSRLVFSVGSAQIPWTLEGLLDACATLPLLLAPNAQIDPKLRDVVLLGPAHGGLLASRVELAKVKLTADTAPGVAATLGTLQRTLQAARILEARAGSSGAVTSLAGMQLSGHLGIEEVGAGISVIDVKPEPQPPTEFQTSIELPWRLKLSPGPTGAWVHHTEPVDHGGRVELWHSRLGRRTGAGVEAVVREGDAHVRAIWARDFDQFPKALEFPKEMAGPGEQPPAVEGDDDVPAFRKSLTSVRRMKIVHQSSNFALKRGNATYVPPVVHVDNLMLTSLGGWLSSKLSVDKTPGGQLDLLEWQHVATMGRDHYVKVMELGFLLPFGHRSVLVTIAERKFQPNDPGNPAFVFVRSFVHVVEPTRSFTSEHVYIDDRHFSEAPQTVSRKLDLVMPLASVTLLTTTTPLLDERTGATGGGRLPGMPNEFFPTVAKTTFGFRILAADRLGNVAEYHGPLLFVTQGTNDNPAQLAKAIKAYYDLAVVDQVQHRLGGQRIGYAPDTWEGQPLDTTLSTQDLRWDVATDGTLQAGVDRPHFAPMLRKANVVVPSINALAGKNDAVEVRYPDHYGALGLQNNAAKVFLSVPAKTPLSFSKQADRAGGFVQPNLAITGLSGATGPIGGSIANAVSGATNPGDFFGGLPFDGAKLFGIVSLTKLMGGLAPTGFPAFVADQVNRITSLQQDLARMVALAEQLPDRISGMAEAASAEAQAVVDAVEDVGAKAALVLQSLAAYTPGGPLAARAADLAGALGGLATALDNASFLPRAVRGEASTVVRRLRENVEDAGELVALMDTVAAGLTLPETVKARMHWSTQFKAWPTPGQAVFQPRPRAGENETTARTTLDLNVEVQAPTKPGKEPSALASCSLTPFSLRLLGKEPFISLDVEKIEFLMEAGKKTDVNVVFAGDNPVTFGGPLSWVNVLQDFIPFDGFSDPPYLEVSTAGIKAGFDLPLPDIPLGVLNLTQVSLGAEVNVPFVGESLDFRFYFCTRERPFHLTVWVFGGGGFFSITVTPEECKILEAAFEFGACASIDFGVASGSIEVVAGIYFRLQKGNSELTGYFRLRGEVDVLGLISASLELYLELSYEIDTKTARGRAELTIEVEVLMFSASVTIECEKKFQGSDQDPTFAEVMGPAPADPVDLSPWHDYCVAFAAA